MFEDIKMVIRNRKQKDRKKRTKEQRPTKYYTVNKIEQHEPHLKPG